MKSILASRSLEGMGNFQVELSVSAPYVEEPGLKAVLLESLIVRTEES